MILFILVIFIWNFNLKISFQNYSENKKNINTQMRQLLIQSIEQ